MLKRGVLNPGLLSLLARVRHTNTLVVADRGFPFWPGVETVDLALCDGIPTVAQVLRLLRQECVFGKAFMAEEFLSANGPETRNEFKELLSGLELGFEPHEAVFKKRVPGAVGLIRTGDTVQYANVVLQSA